MAHHKLKRPSNICPGCERAFSSRKKWARDCGRSQIEPPSIA
ncbi:MULTISPECIES: DUF2256 domain-containing protein [Sphingobium]|uniref:DUF2256 domain-containing protein n=1 Tax=Sphingobium limneticum TaxID=1007511 RepID=A0A5J5IAQ6_9SPHN|nr:MULTISPECIES: DUF2256 domain-containing protein [Sphingobium]KAA9020019.1 DUF2256 domain-containing protein [Sphingobium limneticum]KAA9021501.1 DUF2256 domain-containing protein [Sphingobium limneticum]KAA9033863.1 DUF2256 domain-containing protein [Sphingobium limneticum]